MKSLDDLIRAERRSVDAPAEGVARVRGALRARIAAASMGAASTVALTSHGASAASAASWVGALGSKAALGIGGAVAMLGLAVGAAWSAGVLSAPGAEPARAAAGTAASAGAAPRSFRSRELAEAARRAPELASPSSSGAPVQRGSGSDSVALVSRRRGAPDPAVSARTPGSSLRDELDRLDAVGAALNAERPEEALALVEQRSASRSSALNPEFMAARAVALCRLGRTNEARQWWSQLVAEHPTTPLRARVERACAFGRREER